jgi:heme-degrading monooxygenase HmoA
MYAVIFRAKIKQLDEAYWEMAAKMKTLAISRYGCIDFTSVTEGNEEITVSYWSDQEKIAQWKNDAEHLIAQEMGRSKWYQSYQVEVVEIRREYNYDS